MKSERLSSKTSSLSGESRASGMAGLRPGARYTRSRLLSGRGASMVEYALLIIAIMLLAAVAYKNLGKAVRKGADQANAKLDER